MIDLESSAVGLLVGCDRSIKFIPHTALILPATSPSSLPLRVSMPLIVRELSQHHTCELSVREAPRYKTLMFVLLGRVAL